MVKDAVFFGFLTKSSIETLKKTLNASADWSVYYRGSDVTIYRLEV